MCDLLLPYLTLFFGPDTFLGYSETLRYFFCELGIKDTCDENIYSKTIQIVFIMMIQKNGFVHKKVIPVLIQILICYC